MSTDVFIAKFKSGEIEENEETFEWWAETKLADELKEKLQTFCHPEPCAALNVIQGISVSFQGLIIHFFGKMIIRGGVYA